MHISLSAQTLIVLLVAIIILGIVIRLISGRRGRSRGSSRATKSRKARVINAPGKRLIKTPGKRPLSTRSPVPRNVDFGEKIANAHGHSRSPHWAAVAHAHLRIEPACVVCGYKGHGLQVHHIKPFHLHPELELDPKNLITLCEIKGRDHHLLIGHLDDWESYNPNVRTDVKRYHKASADQIRRNPTWLKEEANRPRA